MVEFDYKDTKGVSNSNRMNEREIYFQQFVKAAMERFNRDKILSMNSLKVLLPKGDEKAYCRLVGQLLDLASKRKCEEISIIVMADNYRLHLPFRLFSISSMKSLRLEGINFPYNQHSDDLHLPLHSLRYLHLYNVNLEGDRVLPNLLASSPLLETLILIGIEKLSKLQVRNLTNLNRLQVSRCYCLKQMDIAAAGLRTLHAEWPYELSGIEIKAPQLTVLNFSYTKLGVDIVARMISEFKSLKSLTLDGYGPGPCTKKLKLSNPNLEEFTLRLPFGLEEIELDTRSYLSKVLLKYYGPSPDKLKQCDIRRAAVSDDWKVEFTLGMAIRDTQTWFAGLKNFIANFMQFNEIKICCYHEQVTFEDEEVDHTELPRTIKHLEIEVHCDVNERSLLNGLFWICRPKLFTIIHANSKETQRLSQIFLNLTSQCSRKPFMEDNGEEFNEHQRWLQQLKDVKIVKQMTNPAREQTCFELTW